MLNMRQLVLISIIFCNGIQAESKKPVAASKKFAYDLGFAKWKRNRVLLDRKGKLPKSAYKNCKDGQRRLKLSFATFLIDAHGKKIAALGSLTLAAGALFFGLHKLEQNKQALARENAKQERLKEAEKNKKIGKETPTGPVFGPHLPQNFVTIPILRPKRGQKKEALVAATQQPDLAVIREFLSAIGLEPNKSHSSEKIDKASRAAIAKMYSAQNNAFFNKQLQIFNALRLAATSQVQSPGFALRLEATAITPAVDPQVANKS